MLNWLLQLVEKKVSNELPAQFVIVIDGWFEGNRNFIAVFASYARDENAKMPLLAKYIFYSGKF